MVPAPWSQLTGPSSLVFFPKHRLCEYELFRPKSGTIHKLDPAILLRRPIPWQEVRACLLCLLHDATHLEGLRHQFTAEEGTTLLDESCLVPALLGCH